MWKKVCCTVLPVPPSGRAKKCKSCRFERPEWTGKRRKTSPREWGGGHMMHRPWAVGAISQPSNCSWGDAVHLWEATHVRWCLGSGGAQGPAMHSEVSSLKRKKEKPAKCPWSGATRSLSFTLQFLLWDSVQTTHSSWFGLLNSLPCSFFFFFKPKFSLSTSQPAPITSITGLKHPSVFLPTRPSLLLFFF